MLKKAMVFCCLSSFCTGAFAQVLLNAGDSFSYHFSSLPTPTSGPVYPGEPVNFFHVQINAGSWGAGDSVLMELFPGQPTGSTPSKYTLNPPGIPLFQDRLTDWTDFEGSVRATVLSGSVLLDQITVGRYVGNLTYSLTVTPVPEPGSIAFVGCAAMAWFGLRGLRRIEQRK